MDHLPDDAQDDADHHPDDPSISHDCPHCRRLSAIVGALIPTLEALADFERLTATATHVRVDHLSDEEIMQEMDDGEAQPPA